MSPNNPSSTPLDVSEAPTPLALAMRAFESESQPFRKVHRLIDAVEVLTKLQTVVVVSDIFSREEGVSDELKGLLAAGLRRPSLGIWWAFARDFTKKFPQLGRPAFLSGIDGYVADAKQGLGKAMDGKDNLINFRNGYAHGATPDDASCLEDIAAFEPRFRAAFESAVHLREALWVFVDLSGQCHKAEGESLTPISTPADGLEPGRCYLVREGRALSLHPLLIYREEDRRFFFYNDLKDKNAGFLNYDSARHHRDQVLREALLARYPIHEWIKSAPEEFLQRMQELTETFKGRRDDIKTLTDFTCEERGFFMVWGGPGIGKSALLARVVQILRLPPSLRESEGAASENPGKTAVIEYFIRRGQGTDDADRLLDNISQRLEQAYKTGIPMGSNTAERARFLGERLRAISEKSLHEHDRLILFIDGLDEGADSAGLLESLPKNLPPRVLAFYASREVPRVRQHLYLNLDRERRQERHLSGLSAGDARAILSEYVSKYDIRQDYVESVALRSEGNPLYLNLLAQGLVSGDFRLNDAIPHGMAEIYEAALLRICEAPGAGDFLRLLAVARDSVSPDMAADVLRLSSDSLRACVLPATSELLVENARTASLEDYQLFHESLREYLLEKFPADCLNLQENLYSWCLGWKGLRDDSQIYALKHLAAHARTAFEDIRSTDNALLFEKLDRHFVLIDDKSYREACFELLGNGSAYQAHCRLLLDYVLLSSPVANRSDRAARLVARYHIEPQSRYAMALSKIDATASSSESLEKLVNLAACGATPRDRALLVLRGLPHSVLPDIIPEKLKRTVMEWCVEANCKALSTLCCEAGVIEPQSKI